MSTSSKVGQPIEFSEVRKGDVIEVTHQYRVESVGAHFINVQDGSCLSHGDWRTAQRVVLADRERVDIPKEFGTVIRVMKADGTSRNGGARWFLTEGTGGSRIWVSVTGVKKSESDFLAFLDRNDYEVKVEVAP